MTLKQCGFILLITQVLLACSTKQNLDYLTSENGKQIVVKRPLTAKYIKKNYYLPAVQKVKAVSIFPPSISPQVNTKPKQVVSGADRSKKYVIKRSNRKMFRAAGH